MNIFTINKITISQSVDIDKNREKKKQKIAGV